MMRWKSEPVGVPHTALTALHGRVAEAKRPGGVLRDPEAIRIYDSMDYDFERHLGSPDALCAIRAARIDRLLRRWLRHHPDGTVVSLGEGLETQRYRVDTGRMEWLSIDLPDAIRLRETFISPGERFRHLAGSTLDPAWMDEVDATKDLFVVAQGLFM